MIVLLLLIAHLVADFWLQTNEMIKNKWKYLRKHMIHHTITTGLALIIIWQYDDQFTNVFSYVLLPLIFIVITHIVIDLAKIKLVDTIQEKDYNGLKKLCFFLIDQTLHVVMLLIACLLFLEIKLMDMGIYLQELIHAKNGMHHLGLLNTSLFIIILFIFATSISGHIVTLLVGALPSEFANFEGEFTLNHKLAENQVNQTLTSESNFMREYHFLTYSNQLPPRGRLIGYIERLLVISLTIIGAYPSIAFIIAAKSIARFKQLDDRNWAEYFLLGTLTSILLGLIFGLIAQIILM